jgi:diguanylate cyclase (GGDEF)-like protein
MLTFYSLHSIALPLPSLSQDLLPKKVALTIPAAQLSQREELAKHLSLAEQYVANNAFELAYLEKKAYLKKYRLYRDAKRKDMMEKLTQVYDINEKNIENELLKSKNKVRLLRVAEIKQEQQAQRNYFMWVIAIAFIFILLFFKQLTVRKKLIKLTKIDVLTGLINRNSLFERGQRLIKKHISQPFDFSVLLIDIDCFKGINDNYGHQIGDQVLITIAKLIGETMRSRDVLARLGGEEFVALLPFADENKAKAIAMHINEKIALYDFSSLGVNEQITLSIGVASMKNKNSRFDDILHGADLAMYQAKKQGRNKVISYHSIATEQERRAI